MENTDPYKVLRELVELTWQNSSASLPDYEALAKEISEELGFEISGRSIRNMEQLAKEPNLTSKETHHKLAAFVLYKQGESKQADIISKQTNKKMMLEGKHWWESFIGYYEKQAYPNKRATRIFSRRIDENIVLKSDKFLFYFNNIVEKFRFPKLITSLFFVFLIALRPFILISQSGSNDYSPGNWWSYLWLEGDFRTILYLLFALTYPIIAEYYKQIPISINAVFKDKIFVKSTEDIERFEIYSLRIFNLRRIRKIIITFLFAVVLALLFVCVDFFSGEATQVELIHVYDLLFYTLMLNAYCTFIMNSFEHASILQSIRSDVLSNVLVFNYQKDCKYHCGGVRPIGISLRYLYAILFFIGSIILILCIPSSIDLLRNSTERPIKDMLSLICACFMTFHLVLVLYWTLLFVSFISYYTPEEKKLRRVITLFNLIY